MGVKYYQDLIVWQKAMDLAAEIYQLVKRLPKEELYGLSDQMRRAAVSIPSNIAEGQARQSSKSFYHFLSIAQGSKSELETQILLCLRLKYVKKEEVAVAIQLCEEIGKMIHTIQGKLVIHD